MDGPLPKLCPAVALYRQDGRHSAVALLLKAALIQVSDYRLLGASGSVFFALNFDKKLKIEKRGDEVKKKSSPLKLLSQSQPNFAEMILRWSPFRLVSVSAVLYPRWPPLLKI